jgi:hypothetical protein
MDPKRYSKAGKRAGCVLMSKVENKPLTKSIDPFWIVFYAVLGHFGTPKLTQKAKACKWLRCMSQCLNLKISP